MRKKLLLILLLFVSCQVFAISFTSKSKNVKFIIEMRFTCDWYHAFWPTMKNNNYDSSFTVTLDEHSREIQKYSHDEISPVINKVVFMHMYEIVTNKLEEEYLSAKRQSDDCEPLKASNCSFIISKITIVYDNYQRSTCFDRMPINFHDEISLEIATNTGAPNSIIINGGIYRIE